MDKVSLINHDRIIRIKTDDEDMLVVLAPDFYKFDEASKAVVYHIRDEARKIWNNK